MVFFMKKLLILCSAVLLLSPACTPGHYRVKAPTRPTSKIIVLPEPGRGKTTQFYEINGKRYYPLSNADGYTELGQASWYGDEFHGRPTASGEIYDMHQKSAAHKTLPLGTYVQVINLSNNKYTFVRINDRGPFVAGRVIDLSFAAAKEIDLIGPGVADVKVVALGKEVGELKTERGPKPLVEIADIEEGEFTIQVGAFLDQNNALELADRLKIIFDYVRVTLGVDQNGNILHRVHASLSSTMTQAQGMEKKLESMGFKSAFIVRN